MRGSASGGSGLSSGWPSENSGSWTLPRSYVTWRRPREITWKRLKATEKGNTVFASTISGASALSGATGMLTMWRLSITTRGANGQV